jgi:hypothetical protein
MSLRFLSRVPDARYRRTQPVRIAKAPIQSLIKRTKDIVVGDVRFVWNASISSARGRSQMRYCNAEAPLKIAAAILRKIASLAHFPIRTLCIH